MARHLERAKGILFVCTGSDCKAAGDKPLGKAAEAHLEKRGLKRQVPILKMKCTNQCKRAPVCSLQPGNRWLFEATEKRLCAVIDEELAAKKG